MQILGNIVANLRSAIGLACVLALASAAAVGQSGVQSFPPLLLAKLRSAQKAFVAPVREDGYQGTGFKFGHGPQSCAPYHQKQVEATLDQLYELVPNGAGADLVFEPSIEGRMVRVAVRDPKTHSALWVFSHQIKAPSFFFNPVHYPETALTLALDDLLRAASRTDMATSRAPGDLPSSQLDVVPSTVASPSAPGTTLPLLEEKLNSAKSVFIASVNTENWDDRDFFRDQINSTVALWGLYRLAPSVSADLVLEPSITGGQVRIVVRDANTRSVLWTFSREVGRAILPVTMHRRLAEAVAAVLDDLRQAVRPPTQAVFLREDAAHAMQPAALPKIFISNIAVGPYQHLESSKRESDFAYKKFHDGMGSSGRFELVAAPAQADLIFEVWEADPEYVETLWARHLENSTLCEEPKTYSYPQIKLVIWDRRTQATLLAATEFVDAGFLWSEKKRVSRAVVALVNKSESVVKTAQAQRRAGMTPVAPLALKGR